MTPEVALALVLTFGGGKSTVQIPACHCGCMEGKGCLCENCCKRTADPTWKIGEPVKTPTGVLPVTQWRTDYNAAVEEAKSRGMPLLVLVSAKDCPHCRVLEKVFRSAPIAIMVNSKFVPVEVSGDDNPEFVRICEITSYPTLSVYDSDDMSRRWRGIGDRDASQLKGELERALLPRVVDAIRHIPQIFRQSMVYAPPVCRS